MGGMALLDCLFLLLFQIFFTYIHLVLPISPVWLVSKFQVRSFIYSQLTDSVVNPESVPIWSCQPI